MSTGDVILDCLMGLALAGAFVAQMVRWLRVLQREHYERFKEKRPVTLSHVLIFLLLVTTILRVDVLIVIVTVAYGLLCPQGLSMKGRTSKLRWTRRLTITAVVATLLSLAVGIGGLFTARPWLAFVAMVWAVPVTLDVTSRLLAPYEHRHSQKFVNQAIARLARVKPRIVAITGSYGKTSTKNHLFELLPTRNCDRDRHWSGALRANEDA